MAMQPGVSVARLAREHGVNANQVFSWRKLYEAGQLVGGATAQGNELLSVVVTAPAQAPAAEPTPTGIITLEIGRVRLRIEGQANAATMAQVLERVLR
nr:transposase [Duganella qianjiadongensis]